MVLIHGVLNDLRSWEHQLEGLAPHYRVIAYSRRYHYPNDPPPPSARSSIDSLVEELVGLLRTLGCAPAHLVGASSGGFIALRAAQRFGDAVKSVVAAEPPVLPLLGVDVPPTPRQLLRLILTDPVTGLKLVRFAANVIGPARRALERGDDQLAVDTFVEGVLGRRAFAELTPASHRQIHDNVGAFKAQLLAGFPEIGPADVRRIAAPTLLITGERSSSVLHSVTDRLAHLLPRSERVDLEDASHLMYLDRPEAFNRAVLGFLGRHEGHGGQAPEADRLA